MYKLYKVNIYSANRLIKSVLQIAGSTEEAIELTKGTAEHRLFVERNDTFSASEVETPGFDAFYVPHGKPNYINWYGTERALVLERDMLMRLLDWMARGEFAQLQGYINMMMTNIATKAQANNVGGNKIDVGGNV